MSAWPIPPRQIFPTQAAKARLPSRVFDAYFGQCLIQDKISTSPSPTDRRAVVTPRDRRATRSSRRTVVTLGDIFT